MVETSARQLPDFISVDSEHENSDRIQIERIAVKRNIIIFDGLFIQEKHNFGRK
ncbi:MAG: hypothetical protein ACJA1O_002601 [Spirosomataceae bacterium]|jgi:hypothetical protein